MLISHKINKIIFFLIKIILPHRDQTGGNNMMFHPHGDESEVRE